MFAGCVCALGWRRRRGGALAHDLFFIMNMVKKSASCICDTFVTTIKFLFFYVVGLHTQPDRFHTRICTH